MFIVDLVRGVLQGQFLPEVPADDYGPRLQVVLRALVESLSSTARMMEAFDEGDTAALEKLVPVAAGSFEAANSARLRLEQVKPEHRLRKLHKHAVLIVRAHLKRQDLSGEAMLASQAGD